MMIHQLRIHKNALSLKEWARILKHGEMGHQIIWKAFGDHPDRRRDFIFRLEQQDDALLFYALCPRQPDHWEGRFEIISKPYHPNLSKGQLLQFQIRLNPSICVKSKPDQKRGQRQDIIAHAKATQPDTFKNMSRNDIAQQVGVQWLKTKLANHGIQLLSEHTLVTRHHQTQFTKRHNARPVTFTVMEFEGLCLIDDPERAQHVLTEGLGRQKSYGMGMLMVKPV